MLACDGDPQGVVAETQAPRVDTSAPRAAASEAEVWSSPDKNALFLEVFRKALPVQMCEPGQFARECFRGTVDECRERAFAELEGCEKELAAGLPLVTDGESGSAAGRVLGSCAGSRYEVAHASLRVTSAACDEAVRKVIERASGPH